MEEDMFIHNNNVSEINDEIEEYNSKIQLKNKK